MHRGSDIARGSTGCGRRNKATSRLETPCVLAPRYGMLPRAVAVTAGPAVTIPLNTGGRQMSAARAAIVTGASERHRAGHRQGARRGRLRRSRWPPGGPRSSTPPSRGWPSRASTCRPSPRTSPRRTEIQKVVAAHRERYGRLDVLVNNAGVGVRGLGRRHRDQAPGHAARHQPALDRALLPRMRRSCSVRPPASTRTRSSSTPPPSPASTARRGCRSTPPPSTAWSAGRKR